MEKIKNFNEQERQTYVPARVKVIEFTAQRVICTSGGTEDSPEGVTNDWFN
mgnify:CR=1 FL=1